MALVVDVEAMVDRMVLQIGDVAGNVDCCHRDPSLVVIKRPLP